MSRCPLLLVAFLAAAPLCVVKAQSSFSAVGELRVSDSACGQVRPEVAVSQGGRVWVLWREAGRWLSQDLRFEGVPVPSAGKRSGDPRGAWPSAVNDSEWTKIDSSFYGWCTDRGTGGFIVDCDWFGRWWHTMYRNGVFAARSDTILSTWSYHYQSNITEAYDAVAMLQRVSCQDFSLVGYCRTHDGGGTEFELREYRRHPSSHRIVFKATGAFLREDAYAIILSPITDSGYSIGVRSREKNGTHTFRSQSFNANGDTRIPLTDIDTVDARNHWGSFRLIAKEDGGSWWISSDPPSQSLSVREIFRDGKVSQKRRFLDSVRNANEYEVRAIGSNGYVCVWSGTAADGSTNVFAGVLDRSMQWLTAPIRVNSDTAGVHIMPSLAVRGDTAYVVWLDSRSGTRHTYLRTFTAGSVTAVQREEVLPISCALEQNFPNPFGRASISAKPATSIQFTLQKRGAVRLRVFDLLGRQIAMVHEAVEDAGTHTVVFEANGVPPGNYPYLLEADGRYVSRIMTVLR
ncbi:MAG: hypothetical protein IPP94_14595 [Ignavibacteria bacterium]|nr:hypothetical protein [Ignavibacteria bacterium]